MYCLIKEMRKNHPKHIYQTRSQNSSSAKILESRLAPKLIRLLNGDRQAAERLVKAVRRSNPNRSLDWCLEKVIHDLEHDRRR